MKNKLLKLSAFFVLVATIGFAWITLKENDVKNERNKIKELELKWEAMDKNLRTCEIVIDNLQIMINQHEIMYNLKVNPDKIKRLIEVIESEYEDAIVGAYITALKKPNEEDKKEWKNQPSLVLHEIYVKYKKMAKNRGNEIGREIRKREDEVESNESKITLLYKILLSFNSFGLIIGFISRVK